MLELKHKTLNATFSGVDLGPCVQYRGIPYGSISERFESPTLIGDWKGEKVDCQKWGPRCPQPKLDLGELARTPEGDVFYDETEDEFKCANLDVTVPKGEKAATNLPVLIWIHGGSQTVSYGNGASKIGDTSKIVKESAGYSKPVIVVSVQYRLNIFHVGDGQGSKNLGLKDQLVAVQWVRDHIAGFGGDPDNITLAGESAGGVFVHALIASGVHVKRGIMMSGNLYLSPPLPAARSQAFPIDPTLKKVQEKGYNSIKEAPVDVVIKSLSEIPVPSVFLQEDTNLQEWQQKTGAIEELMIGDCEFESIIWRNGIEAMTAEQIVDCFDKAGASSGELKQLYHVSKARATQSKHGALDFLNDMRFAMPVPLLTELYRESGKKVYQYLFDQANPWQPSSRAHHAVDLTYLFGGFDMSSNPTAEALGVEMRKRFIHYINGEAPWSSDKSFAFGPLGECKEVGREGVAARRRLRQIERLRGMQASDINAAFGSLAAGRLSLSN
ncbi:hypothetical protein MBLNU459_g7038t1 [Dothideomycetes sp. NU459]